MEIFGCQDGNKRKQVFILVFVPLVEGAKADESPRPREAGRFDLGLLPGPNQFSLPAPPRITCFHQRHGWGCHHLAERHECHLLFAAEFRSFRIIFRHPKQSHWPGQVHPLHGHFGQERRTLFLPGRSSIASRKYHLTPPKIQRRDWFVVNGKSKRFWRRSNLGSSPISCAVAALVHNILWFSLYMNRQLWLPNSN
jgi:hypothetical protein